MCEGRGGTGGGGGMEEGEGGGAGESWACTEVAAAAGVLILHTKQATNIYYLVFLYAAKVA